MYSKSSRRILQMQNAKTLAPASDGEDLDEDTPNAKKATDMATTISTKRTRIQDLDKANLDEIEVNIFRFRVDIVLMTMRTCYAVQIPRSNS